MAEEKDGDGALESTYGTGPGMEDLVDEVMDVTPVEDDGEGEEQEEEKPAEKKPAAKKPAKTDGPPTDILDDAPEEQSSQSDDEIVAEVEEEFPDIEGGEEKDVQAMKTMRERIVSLRKENAGLKSGGDSELQTKLDAANESLERNNYAQSPRFRDGFVKPAEATWEQLATIAKAYEIGPEVLQAAARSDVKERDVMLAQEGIPQSGLVQLLPLFNSFAAQMAAANTELESFKANATEREALESTQLEETTITALGDATRTLQADNNFLLRDSKDNPDWFPGVIDGAKAMMTGQLSSEDLAQAAIKAQLSDHYKNMFLTQGAELKAKINDLESELGRDQSYSKPKLDSSSRPLPSGSKQKRPQTLEELAEAT